MPRLRAATAFLIVGCLIAAGCGRATAPPPPTPADFEGIVDQLSKAGISVANVVSGDAGCPDQTLNPTAIAFDASGLDQSRPIRVRVYIFRNRSVWQRLAGEVSSCAGSYVTNPETYESVAVSPYVVSGQGPWPAQFRAALAEAFRVAAGSGD